MKQIFAILAFTIAVAGLPAFSVAQNAHMPDLKDRWSGMSETIVMGKAPHHDGSQNTPRMSAVKFTLTIDGQEGRRVWGTVGSSADRERILGVIGFDSKTLTAQDSDGLLQGTIVDRDTIEIIYSHATGSSAVVSGITMKREK
jgi:hypothetical protein